MSQNYFLVLCALISFSAIAEQPIAVPEVSHPVKAVRIPVSKTRFRAPSQLTLGTLKTNLFFSQAAIGVKSNGSGTFTSGTICPGLLTQWNYPVNTDFAVRVMGALYYQKFNTLSSTDTFDSPSPWLWSFGAGTSYLVERDFSLSLGVQLKRRIFIRRESLTVLAGDPATIPQAGIGAHYRFLTTREGGISLGAGADYLMPSSTSFSKAHSGVAYTSELLWEDDSLELPLTAGAMLERTFQNTDLGEQSTWNLGLVVGIQFGRTAKAKVRGR